MSSLAGALDGYTQPRHPKMQYNPISEDVEMTASKNEPEGLEDDEEMEDDLFGNDNDVEEQKRLRSVQKLGIGLSLSFMLFYSSFPEHQHRQLLPARILNACLLQSVSAGRPWNMKRRKSLQKYQLKSRRLMSRFRIYLFPNPRMAMSVPVLF